LHGFLGERLAEKRFDKRETVFFQSEQTKIVQCPVMVGPIVSVAA
jgi:hypothetical protein